MEKISIKLNNKDQSIRIPIRGLNNLLGLDDTMTSLINDENDASINDVTDGEVRRFLPATSRTIQFQFWNGSTYVNQVAPLEFAPSQYSGETARKSFFVVQVFDSVKEEIQNKKHTGYFNGYEFAKNNLISSYSFNNDFEFTNLYIPQNYLDSVTTNTIDAYLKFLFYSANSGKFYVFFNNNDTTLTTQDKLYYKITIDKTTFKYDFSFNYNPVTARELRNSAYTSFVNDTVSSFSVAKTNYPTGNTFTNTGNYIVQ